MSTSDLLQRMPAVLIFSLGFTFLTGTVIASENSVGRIPFVISDENEVLVASQETSAISEQASSNWAGLSSLKFGEQEDTSSVGTPGSLAEVYLGRVAEKHKEARKTGGVLGLVAGTALVVGGFVIASDQDIEDAGSVGATFIVLGLAMDGLAIWRLKTPSRAEREFDNVLGIADPAQRERAGREALISLADDARTVRIMSGIVYAIFSAYFFIAQPSDSYYEYYEVGSLDNLMGASYGALALYTLATKSTEEKALQRYLEESKREQGMGLRLGVGPSGRVQVALVLSF